MTGFVTMGAVTSGFVGDSLATSSSTSPGRPSRWARRSTTRAGERSLHGRPDGRHARLHRHARFDADGDDLGRRLRVLGGRDSQRADLHRPVVAVGYDYRIGKGNPRIATVRLTIGIGDSLYRLKVEGRRFTLAGGELFDFRANGFRRGVEKFRVDCIEVDALLDPANPQAFPTESPSWRPACSPARRSPSCAIPGAATSASAWTATTTMGTTTRAGTRPLSAQGANPLLLSGSRSRE